MGKSFKKRFFTKQEINQIWAEVWDSARQFARSEGNELLEMKLRANLKEYLKIRQPMVDEDYIVFEIYMGIAYEPLTEPLTEEQKHRFRNTLEQIVHEPRRWKNIEKLNVYGNPKVYHLVIEKCTTFQSGAKLHLI